MVRNKVSVTIRIEPWIKEAFKTAGLNISECVDSILMTILRENTFKKIYENIRKGFDKTCNSCKKNKVSHVINHSIIPPSKARVINGEIMHSKEEQYFHYACFDCYQKKLKLKDKEFDCSFFDWAMEFEHNEKLVKQYPDVYCKLWHINDFINELFILQIRLFLSEKHGIKVPIASRTEGKS